MTNRTNILTMLFDYVDKIKITALLRVKNIENAIIIFTKTIVLNFNISKIINEKFTIVKLLKKIRIVNNVSIKVFIEINIIDFEKMTINANTLIIDSCKNTKVDLSTIFKNDSIKRTIICTLISTIFLHISMKTLIKLRKRRKFSNRDYMFHFEQISAFDRKKQIFLHILNAKFSKIIVNNNFNQTITFFRRFCLNVIKEFEKNECYLVFKHDAHLTANN